MKQIFLKWGNYLLDIAKVVLGFAIIAAIPFMVGVLVKAVIKLFMWGFNLW